MLAPLLAGADAKLNFKLLDVKLPIEGVAGFDGTNAGTVMLTPEILAFAPLYAPLIFAPNEYDEPREPDFVFVVINCTSLFDDDFAVKSVLPVIAPVRVNV